MMFWVLLALAALPDSACVACHAPLREAYALSVHTPAGVTCVTCHGGQAGKLDAREAHRGMRRLTRKATLKLCADCHTRPEAMGPYHLRVDVLRYWAYSAHGKAWDRDDPRAPLCTDCHGAHEVRSHRDPESPVAPGNQPATCMQCHDNPEVKRYLQSRHYQALQEGRVRAPVCATCHQDHGVVRPRGTAPLALCGRCHVRERGLLAASPHGDSRTLRSMNACVGCHEVHGKEMRREPAELCPRCHEEEEIREEGRWWTEEIRREEAAWTAFEAKLDEAERAGVEVDPLRARLEARDVLLSQAYAEVHTLSRDSLRGVLARSEALRHDLEEALREREAHRAERKLFLGIFWLFVLVTAGVARLRIRALQKGRGNGTP